MAGNLHLITFEPVVAEGPVNAAGDDMARELGASTVQRMAGCLWSCACGDGGVAASAEAAVAASDVHLRDVMRRGRR